ncbi:MAG TPA: hypothetical protein ENH11_00845 [Candidatus Acetothermia bacterium]|nr:hypothetical protein [Candidatus Acetothermia bacterium]
MDTDAIMELALEMAGLAEVPGDTAIYLPGKTVERVLFGIDIGSTELILARNLGYDLAISHHPMGGEAIVNFHLVLERHVQQMATARVPIDVARNAIGNLVYERRILNSMRNYDHAPSIARLIHMPYMNIHTPLDEIGRKRMADAASQLSEQDTVHDLITLFQSGFGEFQHAKTTIEAMVGSPDNRLGRVAISHGAGTNGGYPIAKAYFDHGVDTLVYIHCRPNDAQHLAQEYQEKEKTLIVTGHIASDSLGINPFIEKLRARGLQVTPISGIISPSLSHN